MSSFEKIGVIFVTGLVAVILAMSFFGTGHEALTADELAMRDGSASAAATPGPAEGEAKSLDVTDVRDSRTEHRSAWDSGRDERREDPPRGHWTRVPERPDAADLESKKPKTTPSTGASPNRSDEGARRESNSRPTWGGKGNGLGQANTLVDSGSRPSDVPGESREIEEASQESIGKSSGAGAKPSGSGAKSRVDPRDMWAAARATPPVGENQRNEAKATAGVPQRSQPATKKPQRSSLKPPASQLVNSGKSNSKKKGAGNKPKLDLHRTVYEVRSSDTLSEIAQRELGTSKAWPAIVAANAGLDPKKLRVGQKLLMPTDTESARYGTGQGNDGKNKKKDKPRRKATHRVQRGDTLIGIARAHFKDDDRWRDIYNLNKDKIRRADRLSVGQVLQLPE